jgi:hypothetical protein
MDEHYNFGDARERTVNIVSPKKSPTQSHPGDQLEEWTDVRNTKGQYRKQLRNFLKVSIQAIIINIQMAFTNTAQKDRQH